MKDITLHDGIRFQQQQTLSDANKIINYTGHIIHILSDFDTIKYTIPYEGDIKCPEHIEDVGEFDLFVGGKHSKYGRKHMITIREVMQLEPELPPQKEGVVYIVKKPVAEWAAKKLRTDFLYPGPISKVQVNGRVFIGCRELCIFN